LIELLVVIAIIGLLSSVVLVSMQGARASARDAVRKQDIKNLQTAVELYYAKYEVYPSTGNVLWSEGNCTNFPETVIKPDYSGANAYIPNLAPEFVGRLPGDPTVNSIQKRCYVYVSNGTNYTIWAHLGIEGSYSADDIMVRLVYPVCTVTQTTYNVSTYGRCAPY